MRKMIFLLVLICGCKTTDNTTTTTKIVVQYNEISRYPVVEMQFEIKYPRK
jgi:hypothetical protein